MRLATFRQHDQVSWGIVRDHHVDVLSDLLGPSLRLALPDLPAVARAAGQAPREVPLSQVELLPPIPDPPRIICIGRNFKSGMRQAGLEFPAHPILFARYPHAQVGHGAPIVRPRASVQFDYEGEVAVVIGRPGRHIPRTEALAHVAGYCCYNDGSVRDFQRHTSQDTPGKNFWRSGAAGPWLTTADEVPDPATLRMQTFVNGLLVQDGALDDLLFDVPHIIAYLSAIFPLEPGDTIPLGTPFGVGLNFDPPRWLKPGDRVRVSIPGVGDLENPVVDEDAL